MYPPNPARISAKYDLKPMALIRRRLRNVLTFNVGKGFH